MTVTGAMVAEKAKEYVGVPFRHYGRDKNGVDCVGLVLAVAKDLGVSSYVPKPYSRLVDPEELLGQLEGVCNEVPVNRVNPGDIFLTKVRGVAQHLMIYTGSTVIHSFEPTGYVVEVSYGSYWTNRVHKAFRWKSVNG